MTAHDAAMKPAFEPESDEFDVAGIPFPATRSASKLDFPPTDESDSSLGEVLAFIRTVVDQPGRGTSASRF